MSWRERIVDFAVNLADPRHLDRAIGWLDPRRQVSRTQARIAVKILNSHYDAAGDSRRTHGWKRPGGDANAVSGLSLQRLRDSTRHLVRNNGHAQSAIQSIIDDTVGWGIKPAVKHEAWTRWAESTDIDADGRCDFYGLQHLVMRTIVESGECLIRRRWRRPSDGLALPMQLQVLEPDFIDTSQHRALSNGGKIIRGVEFDAIGRRSAYWLFREHPGSTTIMGATSLLTRSAPVPASEIAHVFRIERAGQVRGAPWFAPVLLRINQFDELADATLMKQLVAACLSVFVSDMTGTGNYLGDSDEDDDSYDRLAPGLIKHLKPGESVTTIDPPTVREYPDLATVTLREIAAGVGSTYEGMTGDFRQLPFSASRGSRLQHWERVQGWRWRMLQPQFLTPAWTWAMQAAALMGMESPRTTTWTAPGLKTVDPEREGLAANRLIRSGLSTRSEILREYGYNPADIIDELAADNEEADARGLVLDSDPRYMTQAGQLQGSETATRSAANMAEMLAGLPKDLVDEAIKMYNGNGHGAELQ